MTFAEELATFRAEHPDVLRAEVFVVDLNAIARGKIVPIEALEKLAAGGMKMPISTPALDIFSDDVYEAGLAIQTGDPDGVLVPVLGTLGPILWAQSPTAQVQVKIQQLDGTDAPFDARNVLSRVVDIARKRGLTPVAALEQEFYLIDQASDRPAIDPITGKHLAAGQVYDLDVSRAFAPMLEDIADAATALGASSETIVSEFGFGQFEVNLRHIADPLAAADQIIALRRAIRGVARAHGHDATFVPKPYAEMPGSGLHLHLSLQNTEGQNVFATGDALEHGIAGCLSHMADCMLIFAPHLASYRRLVHGFMAPVEALWGHDHRGVAVRVPETTGPGARLEHRTSGADANPYLVLAAVLAATLAGLEAGLPPAPAASGEIQSGAGPKLPTEWGHAEAKFQSSDFVRDWLGEDFQRIFAAMKRQERTMLQPKISDVERDLYLRRF